MAIISSNLLEMQFDQNFSNAFNMQHTMFVSKYVAFCIIFGSQRVLL